MLVFRKVNRFMSLERWRLKHDKLYSLGPISFVGNDYSWGYAYQDEVFQLSSFFLSLKSWFMGRNFRDTPKNIVWNRFLR